LLGDGPVSLSNGCISLSDGTSLLGDDGIPPLNSSLSLSSRDGLLTNGVVPLLHGCGLRECQTNPQHTQRAPAATRNNAALRATTLGAVQLPTSATTVLRLTQASSGTHHGGAGCRGGVKLPPQRRDGFVALLHPLRLRNLHSDHAYAGRQAMAFARTKDATRWAQAPFAYTQQQQGD
jgi:hypothetical protein